MASPSSACPSRVGILDLPIELICQILDDPNTNPLLIAQGNKLLNSFIVKHYIPCLPDPTHIEELELTFSERRDVFVEINSNILTPLGIPVRRGVTSPPPTSSTIKPPPYGPPPHIDVRHNLMSFLSLAFEIKTIGKLTCRFTVPINSKSKFVAVETRKFDRFTRFIRGRAKIDEMVLVFGLRGVVNKTSPPDLVKAWSSSLDTMMDACMSKTSSRMTVIGASFPTSWLTTYSSKVSPKLVQRITNAFKPTSTSTNSSLEQLDWSISRGSTPPSGVTIGVTLSGNATKTPTPRHAQRFASRQFFTPIGLPLSHNLHHHLSGTPPAPLTTFKLEGTMLTPEDWKHFLSWLHIPLQNTLTTLKIRNCEFIPARALVKFIHRLQPLTHLTMEPPFPAFSYMEEPYPISLPNLTSICASSDFLMLFYPLSKVSPLSFGSSGTPSLPKLTSLQIIPICQYSHGHPYDTTTCQSNVGEVITRYPTVKIPRIALDMRFSTTSDFDIWSTLPKPTALVISHNVEGNAESSISPATYPPLPPSPPRPPPLPHNPYPPPFLLITELILSSSLFLIFILTEDSGFLEDLLDFLEPFESLTTLSIVYDLQPRFPSRTDGDWMDMIDGGTVKVLKDRCKRLEKVRMEGPEGEVRVLDVLE